MEGKKPTLEQVLQMMTENLGEEPRPVVLMSKVIPEMVFKQAQDRKFVFNLPNCSSKYKLLIMIAVAAAVSSHLCTETFIKIAERSGVRKEETGEAIITARFALASTVFASATEGLDFLTTET